MISNLNTNISAFYHQITKIIFEIIYKYLHFLYFDIALIFSPTDQDIKVISHHKNLRYFTFFRYFLEKPTTSQNFLSLNKLKKIYLDKLFLYYSYNIKYSY